MAQNLIRKKVKNDKVEQSDHDKFGYSEDAFMNPSTAA